MNVVRRGEPGFEQACTDRVFNRRLPDRQPEAVLYARCAQHVVDGVRLAQAEGWQVAVRAGGHSWALWSVRDGALLIDLAKLSTMEYDGASGIVTAGPAVKGGAELAPFLAERGRFFPDGHCPTVGIGGFLLQGGQGWGGRGKGWAAEWVTALDVVTADGSLVRADPTQNSDLYWAARGAGPGFFGVVTRFHLATMPYPKHLAHTVHAYRMSEFDEVMTWLHGMHHAVADTVETVAIGMTIDGQRQLLVTALAFVDDEAQALRDLSPFEECPVLPKAVAHQYARPTTLTEQLHANPQGHRWRVDNAWVSGTPADVVPRIRSAFTDLPNDKAFSIWYSMAPVRQLPDMAFSLQSDIYLASYVLREDEATDANSAAWLADRMCEIEPVTVGQYLGDSDLATRQVRFMAPQNWARLQDIRRVRDPDGLFVGYLAVPDGARNANHWQR